jgi:hypothetical protein
VDHNPDAKKRTFASIRAIGKAKGKINFFPITFKTSTVYRNTAICQFAKKNFTPPQNALSRALPPQEASQKPRRILPYPFCQNDMLFREANREYVNIYLMGDSGKEGGFIHSEVPHPHD